MPDRMALALTLGDVIGWAPIGRGDRKWSLTARTPRPDMLFVTTYAETRRPSPGHTSSPMSDGRSSSRTPAAWSTFIETRTALSRYCLCAAARLTCSTTSATPMTLIGPPPMFVLAHQSLISLSWIPCVGAANRPTVQSDFHLFERIAIPLSGAADNVIADFWVVQQQVTVTCADLGRRPGHVIGNDSS